MNIYYTYFYHLITIIINFIIFTSGISTCFLLLLYILDWPGFLLGAFLMYTLIFVMEFLRHLDRLDISMTLFFNIIYYMITYILVDILDYILRLIHFCIFIIFRIIHFFILGLWNFQIFCTYWYNPLSIKV